MFKPRIVNTDVELTMNISCGHKNRKLVLDLIEQFENKLDEYLEDDIILTDSKIMFKALQDE